MKIYIDARKCGAGKTFSALNRLTANPVKAIYVVDRLDEIITRQQLIWNLAEEHGTQPHIAEVFADRSEKAKVAERIERIPEQYAECEHVIVIITTKGMKLSTFDSSFEGWTIVIDEDPNSFMAKEWNTKVSQDHLSEHYEIVPAGNHISQIKPLPSCPNAATYEADTHMAGLAEFRRHIDSQSVFTTATEFGAKMSWWSTWRLTALRHFDRVEILANAFQDKITYKLAVHRGDAEFIDLGVEDQRTWKRRKITIRYFVEEHRATAGLFAKEIGKQNIFKISLWAQLAHQKDAGARSHYWSKNVGMLLNLPGTAIPPKATGRNDLQDYQVCTMIYSAKASPADGAALRALTNSSLGPSDVARDREYEDLAQFCLRGSIRNPDDDRPFEVRVYDKEQAAFIARFLVNNGYAVEEDVEIVWTDAKLTDKPIASNGKECKPSKSAAERKREQRARDKEQGVKRKHT